MSQHPRPTGSNQYWRLPFIECLSRGWKVEVAFSVGGLTYKDINGASSRARLLALICDQYNNNRNRQDGFGQHKNS